MSFNRKFSVAIYCGFFVLLQLLTSCAITTKAESFPGLYKPSELRDTRDYFKRQVNNVIEESIKPALTPQELQEFRKIKFDFPVTANESPLAFYANDSTVTLPVQSLLFVQELVVAYIWQDVNNCTSTVFEYANMLKYRDASSLPGGKYKNPIDALGIPTFKTARLAQMNADFGPRMQRVFYGMLLFLVAHEVGHVVKGHSRAGLVPAQEMISNEIEADEFALNIVAKNQVDPNGIMLFFLLSSWMLPNEAELRAERRKADHPMNGARVMTVGSRLVKHPELFYPGASASDARIPKLKLLGERLIDVGKGIDSITRHKMLRQLALDTDPAKLITCKTRP